MAVMSVGRVASPIIAIAKAATAATELFKTIDSETPDTSGLKAPEISVHADVVLKDVSFIYPSRPDVQVLDGLNVKFEAGKVTAIVGPSDRGRVLSSDCLSDGTISQTNRRRSPAEQKKRLSCRKIHSLPKILTLGKAAADQSGSAISTSATPT